MEEIIKRAMQVYENEYGFKPNQEDLELWLIGLAQDLDSRMVVAAGQPLGILQLKKNVIARLSDEVAFGKWEAILDRAETEMEKDAYRNMQEAA